MHGGRMEIERRKKRQIYIDIAPLVDVVFLLLLFFMLTFNMAMEQAIMIRLPKSETTDGQADNRQITITIAGKRGGHSHADNGGAVSDGIVFIQKKEIGVEEVADEIRQMPEWSPDVPVNIRADKNVSVGLLVKVIDKVKLSGSHNFNVVTER